MDLRAMLRRARPDAGRGRRSVGPALLLLAVTACASPDNTAAGWTDDLGRTVAVDTPATRIVSLAPSHTELLFAIGAGDRVVGRSQWDTEPPAARAVPSVGDGLNPNVEAVAAQEPDLVVLYASAANGTALAQLAALGIPAFNLRVDSLGDVPRAARVLGVLTGTRDTAERLAASFAAALDSARSAPLAAPRPSVLLVAWNQPPIVIGGGSFQSEIVLLAGGRNAFGDLEAPSAQVSIETIAERDPDLVLITGDEPPGWAARPEWQAVRAVRERRFVLLETTALEHPSFRALDAVRMLAARLEAAR